MSTNTFRVRACYNQAIPKDWREQLIVLLGNRPRRLSLWCELGLFGALSCLKQAGIEHPSISLSSHISITLVSHIATITSTQKALEQARDNLPMPFTFMQTQPGQLFNALGSALDWHGNGLTTSHTNIQAGEAALLHSIQQGALIAWVDELPQPISRWLWLERADINSEQSWQQISSCFDITASTQWLCIDAEQQIHQAHFR